MRLARGIHSGKTGLGLRLLLVTSMLTSFGIVATVAPQPAGAAPTIVREQSAGPVTIGETVDCTVTVTIEPNRSLLLPRIRDEFSNRAMRYVSGSAELIDISRPEEITGVSFVDPTGDPDVIYDPNEGLKLRWRLNDFDNTSATQSYTFALHYQVQVTGVGPNDFVFWYPALADQGFDCTSYFVWQAAADPGTWRSVTSGVTETDVDQPRLRVTKTTPSTEVPSGGWVPFTLTVTNTGWSEAYDIVLRDDFADGFVSMDDPWSPDMLAVDHSSDGSLLGEAALSWSATWAEIDMRDHSLAPGESITVTLLLAVDPTVTSGATISNSADADWSSLPGSVTGERVYNDALWEDFTNDTDTASLAVVDAPYITVDKHIAEGSKYALARGTGRTTFEIVLTNTGTQTAPTIGLVDTYDTGMLSFVSASPAPDDAADDGQLDWTNVAPTNGLAPGESTSVLVTFDAGTTVGYTVNTATALDPNPQSAIPFGGTGTASVLVYDTAGITFSKDAAPGPATVLLPGDVITYHLYGENGTGFDLPAVMAFDPLPDSVEYVPGTLRASVPGYGDMTFTDTMFDPLDPTSLDDYGWYDAATRTVVFFSSWGAPQGMLADMYFDVRVRDLTYSAAGVLNTARMAVDPTSLTEVPTVTSNSVYHFVDPITITKTATDVNGGKLVPGDEILWTITVQNVGLSPTTNVVVTDNVPANTTYVMGSITGTGASDVTAPALRWNVGVLAIDQSATLTFRSRVNDNVPAGTTISNQATVDSDQSNARASDSPATTIRGDATLLQTGGREIVMMLIGLLIALAGAILVRRGRAMMVRD